MKRKLFNAALFAAVVVAAPVGTFVSCADYDSDIENLQGQVTDLQTLLNQKEQALNDKIAALEAQDQALEAAYKAADEALKNQLAQQIADLNTSLSADIEAVKLDLEGQIAACKAECAAQRALLQAEIDSLKGRVATAEGKIAAAEGNITKLFEADVLLQNGINEANSAIAALKTRVETLESGLTEVNGKVSTLEGKVAALEADNTTNKADIATLKTDVAKLKTDVTKLQSDVTKLNEEIGKVRQEFAAADAALKTEIEGKLSELWTQVNANKAAIEAEVTNRETAVSELKGVVDANKQAFETAVGELKSKDTELASSISTLSSNFDSYKDLTNAEIDSLKARMAAVEGQVSVNTQAILDLTARVLDLYAGLDELNTALEAAKTAQATIDGLQDAAILAVDGKVDTLEDKVDSLYTLLKNTLDVLDGKVADNKAAIDTLKAQADSLRADVDSALAQAGTLRTDLDEAIAEYQRQDSLISARIDNVVTELTNKLSEYATKLSKEVKGFVLVPDNYYQGIQAIEGLKYVYTKWNLSTFHATQTTDKVEFCPEVVAKYNVNPSTAVLSTDATNYAYTVEDRVIRGVNNALKPEVKEVAQNGGVLTVKMKLADPSANTTGGTPVAGKPVTVMALQYTNPAAVALDNQVVTSDYAALYLSKLDEVYLLDKDLCTTTTLVNLPDLVTHEYHPDPSDPATDIMPAKAVDVAYNAADGYDVSEHILVRFGWEGVSYTADNLPEGFTLEYTFEDNQQLFTLDGSVVKAKEVLGNIGKNAELRVVVKNGENVAEVGYFKFTVKGEAVTDYADDSKTDADYDVACFGTNPTDPLVTALSKKMSTATVWSLITEKLGITEEEAKAKYGFIKTGASGDEIALADDVLTQYRLASSLAEGGTSYPGIGTVKVNADGSLQWTVTYQDLAGLGLTFPLTADDFPLTTYVLVRSKNDVYSTAGKYNEFYLPLTWAPASVEEWGAGNNGVQSVTWTYDRVPQQWQETQLRDYELRLYADLTQTTPGAPFKYDIPAKALNSSSLKLTGEDYFTNYSTFALENEKYVLRDNPDETARVAVGVSGAEYQLKVNVYAGYPALTAYKVVAGVPEASGWDVVALSEAGVIELYNNDYSKDILNKFERNELGLGQTLAAYVTKSVTCCAGEVEVTNGFNVRFLKPVTVRDVEYIAEDANGATGVVTVDLAESIECFTGKTFKEVPEYFTTFGLSMSVNKDEWTTTYNGGVLGTSLLKNTTIAGLFNVDTTDPAHPLITFTNNTAVLNEFTVRVPLTITHVWGTMTKDVDVVIGRTIGGNSNGRK
ncbi:MAG: hypothetical protein ACI382_03850 [Alloprevotella sp.]